MDEILLVDGIRFAVCLGALILATLVLRLLLVRWRNGGIDHPGTTHPATYLSYVLALVLIFALRIEHLGRNPTWDLWVAAAIVLLGWYGVTRKVRLNRRPPHRRR